MSMDIAHFAFGAAMTSLVITFLVPTVLYPRTLMVLGGGWAMLPDIYRISPIARAEIQAFHESSIWADVFWFHRTLDRVDPTDSQLFAAVLIGFLIVVTLLVERRGYRAPRALKEFAPGVGETE